MTDSFDLAFSTLADPCLWPAPSPLDSPDPLDAFDSILYPTFEREICSNFNCCGLNIPDLHELLAHFEATHVESIPVIHDEPPFPQPRTLPEGARPCTPTPCTPTLESESESATSPSSIAGPPSPRDYLARTHSPELVSRSTSKEPIALAPSLLTTPREPTCGPKRVERRGPRGRFQSHEITTAPRKREKLYHCPKPGCLKSYLNPNGLKYHLDKGTCQLASSDA
ncbi:hypothetical protein EDB92DRAFT_690221 [Lactarius akahatsu]|uniref:C2H2-type domain-containing protein n=1 Tax=Lactarius akahatsu TaxID=416441 RepID=A0AAD4LHA6_9AGAM|nr:hypothetical protein EDB92DRAFT_690221 [Lactarius akahatsu]